MGGGGGEGADGAVRGAKLKLRSVECPLYI